MPAQQTHTDAGYRFDRNTASTEQSVDGHAVVLRNYDLSEPHVVRAQVHDTGGECVFERTLRVGPLETMPVKVQVDSAAYTITAQLENGSTDTTECHIGSNIGETALIETGNGLISVTDHHI